MSFTTLRDRCLKDGTLYEDPEFPATPRSIYYSKVDKHIQWKRPQDLTSRPQFIVENACRFDLDQGNIGNCWYIAGVATLATRPELFQRVVPADQGFGENYAGIFHFNFWRYGKWIEVIIDDRLPTYRGRGLIFCKNRSEPNEFWSALLEKAYSKLHGSYEALEGGWTEDAFVDFTGGVGERVDLKNRSNINRNFFKTMAHDFVMNSLMGCSIHATKENMEHELPNGLVIGHAYSVTKVSKIRIDPYTHYLVRLRNPWGKKEWNGAWSDKSKEWRNIDSKTREYLGLVNDEDGEFWMSYEDWLNNFEELQVCHLPADNRIRGKRDWKEATHHGSWVRGVSAGGCGNHPHKDLYWTNPQFSVTLKTPDEGDDEGRCTLIASLMQKYGRLKRTEYKVDNANIAMSFAIYKLKSTEPEILDGDTVYSKRALELARRGETYQYYRELTQHMSLEAGTYVIVPSTYNPNEERDFLLRIMTEQDAESMEMDIPTAPILQPKSSTDILHDLFRAHAGSDGVVDAKELQSILNEAFSQELGVKHAFELEACRSLLAMMDKDYSGVLEYDELRQMWTELTTWQGVYRQFDADQSGYIEVKELRSVFKSIGYSLSKSVLKAMVRRYGGKEAKLAFNDFILVVTKVVVMMEVFNKHSKKGLKGKAEFSLNQFMEMALYY